MTKAAQAMKKAWELFKKAGIKTMDAWKTAIRQAWAIVKGVVNVKNTILGKERKNLVTAIAVGENNWVDDYFAWGGEDQYTTKLEIVKETEKAIQIDLKWSITCKYTNGEFDCREKEVKTWLPKSQIEIYDDAIVIPVWLAKEKGFKTALCFIDCSGQFSPGYNRNFLKK